MTTPRIGIIGGSGLGERLAAEMAPEHIVTHDLETPFGPPSGSILTGRVGAADVALLSRHGDGHVFNPSRVPYRANVFALKALGCTHVIASGATGSLREDIAPGDLVLVDQFIDRTEGRPRTFFDAAAVHVEFAEPTCPGMRAWLGDTTVDATVHASGTYVCIEGPSFSTRAESEMHRAWGADLVGMTAMPEARLVREAEMAYALIGLPTDYDCWRPRAEGASATDLLTEIIGNLQHASDAAFALLRAALADVTALAAPSPAHTALALGIWSQKTAIDPAEVDRLDVLWGKYFASAVR